MENVQTLRFSSNNSIACHNVEELSGGNGALNLYPQSNCNSYSISSSKIVIKIDPTVHTSGSSAIATRNITNYPWDLVYIPGNLVAVHTSGNFIAYAIIAPSSPNGIVRIISRRTGVRGLIKNIPGFIKDLAFAYLSSRVLLAFTDQYGTLFVYEVHEEEKILRTQLLVEVKRSKDEETSDFQRVIWCPFIPDDPGDDEGDDDEEDNFAYLLLVSNGPQAEIWHITTLIQMHGTGAIEHSHVKPGPGYQVMEKHSAPISDAAFSPDGTAIATASLDGFVKFFQVYMDKNSPRCLHQWNPHEGKPLSCLFFLDNHKNPSPEVQFWKYAVTGASNNTEIKTWSCETWQCNQVVTFEMNEGEGLNQSKLSLKAAIDPSSKYLVLSDIYRRVLYVLILFQEPAPPESVSRSNGDALKPANQTHAPGKVGVARIVSISELPIQYPAIFLAITGAEWKSYKRWKHEQLGQDGFQEDHEEAEEDSDNIDIVEGLVIKSVLINTKSLQDATIQFQPVLPLTSTYDQLCKASSSANHNISSSQDSIVLKDGLTDLSLNMSSTMSDMETSLGGSLGARKASSDAGAMDNGSLLVSFPCKPVSSAILGADRSPSSASTSAASVVISSLACGMSESHAAPILTSPSLGASISRTVDCTGSNQPVTMNLLTPESFSSPGRVEEDDLIKKEGEMSRAAEANREKFSKSSPSDDFATLSLLLRANSGSRLPTSEASSPGASLTQNSDRGSKNILETVVSGSSRSPVGMLPPPPRTGPSPLPSKEDAPLATSEVSRVSPTLRSEGSPPMLTSTAISGEASVPVPHLGGGIGLASSTSSPSLEVQQILHSHNNKAAEFGDEEEDGIEAGQSAKESGAAAGKDDAPHCSSLQDLINITAASKHDSMAKAKSQSPLIDMFEGFKILHSSSSQLTHLIESGKKQTSPLLEPVPSTLGRMSEGGQSIPVSSLTFAPKDINVTALPLLKSLSAGKNHLTCEELEAEIKCASPTQQKKAKASDLSSPNVSSAPSLNSLFFPMSLGASASADQVSSQPHNDTRVAPSLEQDTRYEKTVEEISSLRQLILSCDSEQGERTKALMDHTRTLSNQLDKSMKNMHQMSKAIDELRKSQMKLIDQMPHLVTSTAKTTIDNCIRQELRNSLSPALNKCIDPIRSHLGNEIRNLVSNSEVHLSEALSKSACSRTFIDSLSASVASALSVSVQSACREAYNKVVVPGFNAITQQVFSQLNESFTRGTKEYMQHVENESQSTRNALMENLSTNSRNLEATNSTLSTHVNVLIDALQKNIAQQSTLPETLGERFRHLIHDEIGRAMQEHHATVEARTSRAQTPAPSTSHTPTNPKVARQQVQQIISQGQFNLAFKQALSASDLSLVVFVCERINPQQLFSQTPCPLTQDVLLSLVNQLSHDLTTFTDLKTKYLEEAVMNLDTNHPVTREHMRKVLQEFQRSLATHIEHNPNHKKLKMLLLAVNHLVGSA